MELELKTQSHVFYDRSPQRVALQERTCEVIVSDSQPDILCICGVTGALFGPGPSLTGGAAEFHTVLRAAVLYLPEDGDGICSIPVTADLPFRLELGEGGEEETLFGSATLAGLDARIINPRKVLVRAEAAFSAGQAWQTELSLPVSAEGPGVELLTRRCDPKLLCAAGKRSFSLDDAFTLPAAVPAAREVLCCQAHLTAGEYNVIGRRLVFKGALTLELLYRTVASETARYSLSLPFSQIAELEGLEEGAECVITLLATSAEVHTTSEGDGRQLEFTVGCEAQISAYAHKTLTAITDLYATGMQAEVELREHAFPALARWLPVSATLRDSAETPRPVREVRSSEVYLRPLRLVSSGGSAILTGEAEVCLCCTDDSGELLTQRRRVPVNLDLGETWTEDLFALPELRVENLAASPSAGSGVELRFDVCGGVSLLRRCVLDCVAAARLEPFPADAPPRPSVTLKAPGPGETLWAVAKRYSSTVAELAAANGLESAAPEDAAPAGRVLLIPKSR